MVIRSLNTMEKIVNRNTNLMWDGWNVIDLKESNVAKTSPVGIRIKDKWYLHKVYIPNRNGWNIPNKYQD
jgi:hypothetical protein